MAFQKSPLVCVRGSIANAGSRSKVTSRTCIDGWRVGPGNLFWRTLADPGKKRDTLIPSKSPIGEADAVGFYESGRPV
jgi:hypothetical protein